MSSPLEQTEHPVNTSVYLSIVTDCVHSFMTAVYPSTHGCLQQGQKSQMSPNWMIETWWLVHCTQIALYSHQISVQSNAWCCHISMGQIFSATFWIHATKHSGISEGSRSPNLIKWPVNVCGSSDFSSSCTVKLPFMRLSHRTNGLIILKFHTQIDVRLRINLP